MRRILYPVSVSALIFNAKRELLMFLKPGETHWRTVSGWVESESLTEAVSREINEETGTLRFRVMDVIDAHTFMHQGTPLISVWFLAEYLGGEIIPSDDLQGSRYQWFTENDLTDLSVAVPSQPEIIRKAFAMIRFCDVSGSKL